MKKSSKKKTTFSLVIFIVTICVLASSLSSCSSFFNKNGEDTRDTESKDTESDVYASLIVQLQNKIEKLESEQSAADSENEKKLDELKSSLESINSETEAITDEESSSETTQIIVEPHFTYTTEGNSATITGYTGDGESLVIPSYIDGYKVEHIADSAFSSEILKRIVISDGVKSIGWFAFYECDSVTSVTIPSSVERIGHSAFSSTAKFTIYCQEDSFAHSFAQSYGIDYALI